MRERTRRLAQAELTTVAQDLFVEQGYDATTVDQIAAAAGMSKRTFFRYFASKDDLVIGKYDLFGDQMVEELRSRPLEESVWESLRRVLDLGVVYVVDEQGRARNEAMDRIVHSTPALNAGYLEKFARMQRLLVAEVRARRASQGASDTESGPRPAALVGAAFACFEAARLAFLASDQSRPFEELLDECFDIFEVG